MDDVFARAAVPLRIYFHCGWMIEVTPDFESEMIEGGETLRMFDPGERREIFLSSTIVTPFDGGHLSAKDILTRFPPVDMGGLRYQHDDEDFRGGALWFFGDDDVNGAAWVLMGMVISEETNKVARCTVVCTDEADHGWALATWRSVRRETPELAMLKGKSVIIREI